MKWKLLVSEGSAVVKKDICKESPVTEGFFKIPRVEVITEPSQDLQNRTKVDRSMMLAHWYVICFIYCILVSHGFKSGQGR